MTTARGTARRAGALTAVTGLAAGLLLTAPGADAVALTAAKGALDREVRTPGTSWAVDPHGDRLVVTADSTVRGADLARLRSTVRALGDRVTLRRVEGAFRPFVAGGDPVESTEARCSLGFNVTRDGRAYFLTAGHCGDRGSRWSARPGGPWLGTMELSRFPGDDYALVRYTGPTRHPSAVRGDDGAQRIVSAGMAVVGQQVTRSGSTSGVHHGRVTGLDVTVNYPDGRVEGLIQTTVCAEPGDSGGPLYDGSVALGLTSGGNGNCAEGGVTFFQPVPEVLRATDTRIG